MMELISSFFGRNDDFKRYCMSDFESGCMLDVEKVCMSDTENGRMTDVESCCMKLLLGCAYFDNWEFIDGRNVWPCQWYRHAGPCGLMSVHF